jgi:hypothetical protein
LVGCQVMHLPTVCVEPSCRFGGFMLCLSEPLAFMHVTYPCKHIWQCKITFDFLHCDVDLLLGCVLLNYLKVLVGTSVAWL